MRSRTMLCAWMLFTLSPLAADDFSDDFNRDDGEPDGWFIQSGTVRIVDEELLLEGEGVETWTWIDVEEPFRAADDVELTIEFDILFDPADSLPDVGRHGGIMFFGSDRVDRWNMDGYTIDWIDRGSDHGYRFYKWTGGAAQLIVPEGTFRDVPDPAESWKISIVGQNIVFEADGEFIEIVDADFREGTIGFWGYSNGQHIHVDNLVITERQVCAPAVIVTRDLQPLRDEVTSSGDFEDGDEIPVVLTLSDVREAAPDCPVPGDLVLTETLPDGWSAKDASDGGSWDAGTRTITWNLPAAQVAEGTTRSYVAVAAEDGTLTPAAFRGQLLEEGQKPKFTRGDSRLFPARDFDDCGGLRAWNVLGGFGQPGGANPGEDLMRMDFLTDGDTTELDFLWFPGATIATDFGGAAASTSLISGDPANGRNPNGVPEVFAFNDGDGGWLNLNDEVFGNNPDNVMAYQQIYIVNTGDPVEVNLGASSDDAIQVILNEEEVWINSVARGGRNDACNPQDIAPDGFTFVDPLLLEDGVNSLIVKTWEGGGGWNSTIAFLDPVTNTPILNGDVDGDGEQDLFLEKLPPDICVVPPVVAARAITARSEVRIQHSTQLGWQSGDAIDVAIAITQVRAEAGACTAPAAVTVTETVPEGFSISGVTPAGEVAGNTITWTLGGGGVALEEQTLSYTARAGGEPRNVTFGGSVFSEGDATTFATLGDSVLVNPGGFSRQGFINSWLLLGPYQQSTGFANPNRAAPGEDNMREDWLTDGDSVFELDVEPVEGDTVSTDFGGASPATGISQGRGDCGINPGDPAVPTWFAWNDADDTIAFEDYYCGDVNDIMMYAVTYVHAEEAITWDIGTASDDSIQILVNDVEVWANNVARGGGGSNSVQDVVPAVDLQAGVNKVMVKVWEGGGGHNFRMRFQDPITQEPVTEGLCVSLSPESCGVVEEESLLRSGDVNGDAGYNISDPVAHLNFLFAGGGLPECYRVPDSDPVTLTEDGLAILDFNGDGGSNIADAVASLNFLFGGGAPPALGEGCAAVSGGCASNCQ